MTSPLPTPALGRIAGQTDDAERLPLRVKRKDGVGFDVVDDVGAQTHARLVDLLHLEIIRPLGPPAARREKKTGAAVLDGDCGGRGGTFT